DANVLQLYHGTKHSCNIKELNSADMLCKNAECCTCGIVRNGPRLSLAKTCEIGSKYVLRKQIIEMYRINEKDTRIEGDGVSHSQERQPVPEELNTLEKFLLEKVSDKCQL
ncbi:14060_t:CDS:2, partial [Racocetra fulgida]